jgi:hypothetical protein
MYKQLGKDVEFRAVIDQTRKNNEKFIQEHPDNIIPVSNLIFIYAQLAEREEMLKLLNKYKDMEGYFFLLGEIENSAIFDPYQNDPEFKTIIEQLQFNNVMMQDRLQAIKEAS